MAQVVWILKRGRARGLSGMKEEDKGWLIEASRKMEPVTHWWRLLVRLIHKACKDRALLEEVVWATMVLFPK